MACESSCSCSLAPLEFRHLRSRCLLVLHIGLPLQEYRVRALRPTPTKTFAPTRQHKNGTFGDMPLISRAVFMPTNSTAFTKRLSARILAGRVQALTHPLESVTIACSLQRYDKKNCRREYEYKSRNSLFKQLIDAPMYD